MSFSKYPECTILYFLSYGVGDDFVVLPWEKERDERKDFLKIYHFMSGEKNKNNKDTISILINYHYIVRAR